MNMSEWAKKEVEIACKREKAAAEDSDEWDYGCACYESALKAFECLMGDGHSGMSIGITKNILNRLIEGKPLTPIEDTEDVWDLNRFTDGSEHYQCKRMSALFKDVKPDGTVTYTDVDRVLCFYVNDKRNVWRNGFVRNLYDEMDPITMPYWPGKRVEIACEEFLTDPKNGDFDTLGILYAIVDGQEIGIDRYFKEGEKTWIEIDRAEYMERYLVADALERGGENV